MSQANKFCTFSKAFTAFRVFFLLKIGVWGYSFFPEEDGMDIRWYVLGLCILAGGCLQTHLDDDLRVVPVTNNPHIIQDPHRGGMPGVGY